VRKPPPRTNVPRSSQDPKGRRLRKPIPDRPYLERLMGPVQFEIQASWPGNGCADQDAAHIAMKAGNCVLTRLVDDQGDGPSNVRDYVRASAVALALWWADNWWRLRYEPYPSGLVPSTDWRLRHELTSASGGTLWPPLMVYGEGRRVVVAPRAGITDVPGPVRYLNAPVVSVDAAQYEAAIDAFFREVRESCAEATDFVPLSTLVDELSRERNDPESAAWRRMEAMLGFDPDDAPAQLVARLGKYEHDLGEAAIEEAAVSAPGPEAANCLEYVLEATAASQIRIDRSRARDVTVSARSAMLPPWQLAEEAAREFRHLLDKPQGIIDNGFLADILHARWKDLSALPATASSLPYGAVDNTANGLDRLALQSQAGRGPQRRFELARALADAVWEKNAAFAPISRAKTDRQKFQRAFAQSFLCPFDELIAFIDTQTPTEKDIRAAARRFHVSDAVIQTVLVNKQILPRERLEDKLEAA